MDKLPREILSLIVSFLPKETLIITCSVNSIFNDLSSHLIYKVVKLDGTKAMELFAQGNARHEVNILSLASTFVSTLTSKSNKDKILPKNLFSRILARCDRLVELHVLDRLQLPLILLLSDSLRCKSTITSVSVTNTN